MVCDGDGDSVGDPAASDSSSASDGDSGGAASPSGPYKKVGANRFSKGSKKKGGGGMTGGRTLDPKDGYWPDPSELHAPPAAAAGSKVAFMFLTRGPMPLEKLWRKFFRDDSKGGAAG